MASSSAVASMNAILNPFLFQVIGSTPIGLRDNIKGSGLKGKLSAGSQLASTAVFAAAVNKATLENFIAKDAVQEARPMISTAFSISGKTNMTALTLLGHCLLTTSVMDSVGFVKEFRLKMGQHDLWSGEFSAGSLSEKQKTIYREKKRVTNADDAKLLGSGYFKYVGIDTRPFTTEESNFWGETAVAAINERFRPATTEQKPMSTPPRPPPTMPQYSPPQPVQSVLGRAISDGKVEVRLSNGTVVHAKQNAVNFYLSHEGNTEDTMVRSIERGGIDSWNSRYGAFAEGGPGAAASTVMGS